MEDYVISSSLIEDLKKEFAKYEELQAKSEPTETEKEDKGIVADNIERLLKRTLRILDLDALIPFVSVDPRFTLETIRGYIDSVGMSSKIKDNNIVLILSSDEDFPFDVVMLYAIEGEWMKCAAYPVGCDIKDKYREEALNIMNEYNKATRMFKTYSDDEGTVWLERQEFIASCIKNNDMKEIIRAELKLAWKFYKDNKDFFILNKNE